MLPLVTATQALCAQVDPELFFAQDSLEENGKPSYTSKRMAKYLCAECPLTLECLRTAIESGEAHGIWGGAMPKERKAIHTVEQAETYVAELKAYYTSVKRDRKK